jgi:hypothetical protein
MRIAGVLSALLGVACASGGMEPRSADGVRAVARQAPVETACTADARRITDFGVIARTEHSEAGQATVVLQNAGAKPRRVVPERVGFCHGPCDSGWTSCESHRRFEPRERARYDVVLAPGESIELLVDARRSDQRAGCEKSGLFVIAGVDGTTACTDAGTWISLAARD